MPVQSGSPFCHWRSHLDTVKTSRKDELRMVFRKGAFNKQWGFGLTGRGMVITNVEKVRKALNCEGDQQTRWKLSFLSLARGSIKTEEAAGHFGIAIPTAYKWISRWNSEGVEGLRRKRIPGRPAKGGFLPAFSKGRLRCVMGGRVSLLLL